MINSTPSPTSQSIGAPSQSSESLDKSPTSKLNTAVYGRFAVVTDDGTRHTLLRTKKINLTFPEKENAAETGKVQKGNL